MAVAENYQKYISQDLENKVREEKRRKAEEQGLQIDEADLLEELDADLVASYVEQLGQQMELILNILP